MSVKIRLRRMGAKKKPFYRLVVADARSPRDGRFIEAVGIYDPLASPALVKIDAERVKDWISKGARPTDVARQLLVSQGLLERTGKAYEKADDKPRPSKKAQAKAAAAAEAPAEKPDQPEPAEEAPPIEAPAKEAPPIEAPAKEAPPIEAPAEEAPPIDAPAEEAPPAEASAPAPEAAPEKSAPQDTEPSSPASETETELSAPEEQHAEAPAEGGPETGEAKK